MTASLVNALIGEYRLTEALGAGGMGEVYKAVHIHHGRVIAVKVLSPDLTDGPALQRFYGEANIQASLRNPGVPEYFGFYEYQGRPCLLMEFIDGETLTAILARRGPLPALEAAAIVREVAAVVAHFHRRGVVHRDLKPGNVKINSAGRVKVLDFGIARHQRADRLTRVGAVVGTPATLAPEQVKGQEAVLATDVWQIGILFFELLTNRMPFEASNPYELYARIISTEAPSLAALQPPAVASIVSRCLEKDPARRYPSAVELHEALCALDQKVPPQPAGGRRTLWVAASVAAALLAIGLLLFLWIGGPPVPRTAGGGNSTGVAATPRGKSITVDTAGGAAQVYRNGELVGSTPYAVQAGPGESVSLILKRSGYEDRFVQFEASERNTYTFTLDPKRHP
jgi:eukaryotic-like serine/threonine-protein kinase